MGGLLNILTYILDIFYPMFLPLNHSGCSYPFLILNLNNIQQPQWYVVILDIPPPHWIFLRLPLEPYIFLLLVLYFILLLSINLNSLGKHLLFLPDIMLFFILHCTPLIFIILLFCSIWPFIINSMVYVETLSSSLPLNYILSPPSPL